MPRALRAQQPERMRRVTRRRSQTVAWSLRPLHPRSTGAI